MEYAEPRRAAYSARRCHEAVDRQVWSGEFGERVSVQGQGTVGGGADQQRDAEQGALRADLDPEGSGGDRCGEDVSGIGGRDGGCGKLDVRCDAEGGRGVPQDRQDVRDWLGNDGGLGGYRGFVVRRVWRG